MQTSQQLQQQDNDDADMQTMDIPLPNFCVPLETSDAMAFHKTSESSQNLQVVPMQDFANQTSHGSVAGAMVHLKGKVYAQCQKKVVAMLAAEVQQGVPGMGLAEKQMLVNRLASQLAAWAVYGEMPPDLKQAVGKARADDVFKAVGTVPAMSSLSSKQGIKQTLPALLIGNRQRDALFMLQADAGIIKGPLPETNLAFRDAQSEGLGAASQAQEAAHQDVVASLAQKLLGADQRGQPKPLARVLMRARDLTADGVLVSRDLRQDKHAHDMAECILVCSQEAEQMLKNQRGGEEEEEEGEEESSSSSIHQTETKQLLKAWTSARDTKYVQFTNERRKLPDQNAMHIMFTTSRPKDETGYETSDRMAYYRQPVPKAGLPRRVGLPVSRDMMAAFMQRHRATMDNVAMWRMAMDAVFPTCPMVNILVDDAMPYHMSGHAMLEEYMTLIRFASDRVASPGGVRPVAPTMAEVWMRDEDVSQVKIKAQASLLAFSPLRAKVTDWNGLPDWCGKWFLPLAYMARPRNHAEFNLLYPEGTLERQTLGKVWMNTTGDIPPTVLLECFEQGCDRVEAVDAKKKKKKKPVVVVEETDMEIDIRTCRHCHEKKGGHLHNCPERIMDSQQKLAKVIADREAEMDQPDRSKPGRAETLMVLSAMRAYYGLLQASIAHHDANIEALRTRYGSGVNCGNGFDSVRPAAYYEELWQAGLKYTVATLEIHEMTLLLIHGRWVDTDKLRSRLVGAQTRLSSEAIKHANGLTVDRAVSQRTKALRRRMAVDGRYAILSKGLQRCPDREGRFASSCKTEEKPKWLLDRVAQHKKAKLPCRADAPTYEEMILFDHLTDYVPLQHEADQAMKGLVARTQAMTVHAAAEAARDPEAAEIQHAMPTGLTATESGENDKRGRQTEENRARPKPIRVKRSRNVSTHSAVAKTNGGGDASSSSATMEVDN